MGVPSFYRWLSRKYPKIVLDVVEEKAITLAGAGEVPVDSSKQNPNNFEVDNLYLDMNGIIHPCCHPEDGTEVFEESDMIARVFRYIDRIFAMVRPRKVLYMAIDGVAPRAKMNQQRSRRFRSAKEVEDAAAAEDALREEWIQKGLTPPPRKPRPWDSNVITPGTPFMAKLSRSLHWYINDRITNNAGWRGVKVIFSDAKVPGEGEHKIMHFIRLQRASKGFDPNTREVLYGMDADLIMLGLASHNPHFLILRETITDFNKPQVQKCFLCGQVGHRANDCSGIVEEEKAKASEAKKQQEIDNPPDTEPGIFEKPFQFLLLNVLREYLAHDLFVPNLPFSWDLERVIDDFVFLCFFVGNDFLPHLPLLEIHEGAIERLVGIYKRLLPSLGGYLSEPGGGLNLSRVDVILTDLGLVEDSIFKNRRSKEEFHRQRDANRNAQLSARRGQTMKAREEAAAGQLGMTALSGTSVNMLGKNIQPHIKASNAKREDSDNTKMEDEPELTKSSSSAKKRKNVPSSSDSSSSSESEEEDKAASTSKVSKKSKVNEAGEAVATQKDAKKKKKKKASSDSDSDSDDDSEAGEEKDDPGYSPASKKAKKSKNAKEDSSSSDSDDEATGKQAKHAKRKEAQRAKKEKEAQKAAKLRVKSEMEVDTTSVKQESPIATVFSSSSPSDSDPDDVKPPVVNNLKQASTAKAAASLDDQARGIDFGALLNDKLRKMNHPEQDPDEEKRDPVRFGTEGWKPRYYSSKLHIERDKKEDAVVFHKLFKSYAEGISWVMKYYYEGCVSWNWYYPFHYAPMASDLTNLDRYKIEFEKSHPFKPIDQLMGVLPAKSAHALPVPCQELMINPLSPIIDFYPRDFALDLNGKRALWQAVALLPWIEEDRLLTEVRKVEPQFNEEERDRNTPGVDYLFVHKSHLMFNSIYAMQMSFPASKLKGKTSTECVVIHKEKVDVKESGGMNGFISPYVPLGELDGSLASEVGLHTLEGIQAVSVVFNDPPFKSHQSILLPGLVPPKPVLQPEDFDDARRGGTQMRDTNQSRNNQQRYNNYNQRHGGDQQQGGIERNNSSGYDFSQHGGQAMDGYQPKFGAAPSHFQQTSTSERMWSSGFNQRDPNQPQRGGRGGYQHQAGYRGGGGGGRGGYSHSSGGYNNQQQPSPYQQPYQPQQQQQQYTQQAYGQQSYGQGASSYPPQGSYQHQRQQGYQQPPPQQPPPQQPYQQRGPPPSNFPPPPPQPYQHSQPPAQQQAPQRQPPGAPFSHAARSAATGPRPLGNPQFAAFQAQIQAATAAQRATQQGRR